MKIFNLALLQLKIKKGVLIGILILVLVAIVIGVYFWLQKTGKFPQFNLATLMAKLAILKISKEATPSEELFKEVSPEDLEITLPSESFNLVYEETAQQGEGITHLARKALKRYLEEKGSGLELTPEHKIYIEDYLQNKTGERGLLVGEKISFSEELIKEAINKAQQLQPSQLENLKQYSSLVSF